MIKINFDKISENWIFYIPNQITIVFDKDFSSVRLISSTVNTNMLKIDWTQSVFRLNLKHLLIVTEERPIIFHSDTIFHIRESTNWIRCHLHCNYLSKILKMIKEQEIVYQVCEKEDGIVPTMVYNFDIGFSIQHKTQYGLQLSHRYIMTFDEYKHLLSLSQVILVGQTLIDLGYTRKF